MKNDLGNLSDLVSRAASILAQQTPAASAIPTMVGAPPAIGGPPSGFQQTLTSVFPGVASVPPAASVPTSMDPEQLRQRAVELLTALFSSVAAVPAPQPAAPITALMPWLQAPAQAVAGKAVCVPVAVENAQSQPADISLFSTDLLSDLGRSIPAYLVSFEPPSVVLAPGQKTTVNAKIAIPLQAIPGSYSGLIQTQGLSAVKSVITVEVV
jgi:hypothetical protein